MSKQTMTSMERFVASLLLKTPDKVPLCLFFSSYGAKEQQLSIKEYFKQPELVAKTQLHLQQKYKTDCLYTFSYAPLEIEAFGGEVLFSQDGTPNAGEPIIKNDLDINNLELPKISQTPCLLRTLEVTSKLKIAVKETVPIIGVVMSPFSLPIMQMGFENYLNLLYLNKPYFLKLMHKNIEFCTAWANAQLKAGATTIFYFDPLSSGDFITRNLFLSTGYKVAQKTLSYINGFYGVNTASAKVTAILEDLINLEAKYVSFSTNDDIVSIKQAAAKRICLVGNLNGIKMVNWSEAEIVSNVKSVIKHAGRDGGLMLAESHGEIPWQVSEKVLLGISAAVEEFGRYPLTWCNDE